MSIDGANLGIKPTRALETILGGKPTPKPEESVSREKMLAEVMAAPDNYEELSRESSEASYNAGCMWLAKQFYLLRKDGVDGDAWFMFTKVKNKHIEKWKAWDPDFTGFMVGYANNLSRWLVGKPEQKNPALLTIGE